MRFVIAGLTITSSWGNGHATTWRGLLAALQAAGHSAVFFEQDTTYYAAQRDLPQPPGCELVLYDRWDDIKDRLAREVAAADVAVVSSYCPDGLAAIDLVRRSSVPCFAFYDIDTPVTLADLTLRGVASASSVRYLTADLIPEFDLYLSFSGGRVLTELEQRWGARRPAALYCSVDPLLHRPVPPVPEFACDLSYLGTYAEDRQPGLNSLLVAAAHRHPERRFLVAGPQYPAGLRWPANVRLLEHLPPELHAAFYSSARLSLNLTRAAMVTAGHSPSVRLFEAAACGAAVVSDWWPGLETLLRPGEEILVATSAADLDRYLALDPEELRRIGDAARRRVLADHTARRRAEELVELCLRAMEARRSASSSGRRTQRTAPRPEVGSYSAAARLDARA